MLEDIRAPDDIFKPQTFEEYIGQAEAKRYVKIVMEAAEKEERYYPNILISGSAGLGKTSLAKLILKDLYYEFIDGSSVNTKYKELYDWILVDEIHNVKPEVCDSLNILLDNKDVAIIGCTTNPGMLPHPFRTRFRTVNLIPYSYDELVTIMENAVSKKGTIEIAKNHLLSIAKRGRRTPRIALQYLSFVIDLMVVNDLPSLDNDTLYEAFSMMGVDEKGLLPIDHLYLSAFPANGRPVGIQYLSAVTQTDKETIEQEIEPYLLSLKLIDRTPKGRVLIGASS